MPKKTKAKSKAKAKAKTQTQKPINKPLEWKSLEKLPTKRQQDTYKNFEKSGFDLTKLKDCAEDAGYPEKYAERLGRQALRAYAHNPAVIEALQKHNITIDRTVSKVSDIMDAKHPNPGFGHKDENGKLHRAEDYPTQLKAVQEAHRLLDVYPSKKIDISETVHKRSEISVTVEWVERAKKVEAMIEGDVIDAEVI